MIRPGDSVKVVDPQHFRFNQVGIVRAAPDQKVLFVEFQTLGHLFYCSEWIESAKLKIYEDDSSGGEEVQRPGDR